MPIVSHPSFSEPGEEETLWRYMEFAKFAALVTTGGLWFANAEVLATEDPFEGALSQPHYKTWTVDDFPPGYFANFGGEGATPEKKQEATENLLKAMGRMPELMLKFRRGLYLNCWHSSLHESAAMWKSYGKHDGGIAITTNLKRLKAAFLGEPKAVYCGRITYIDFDKDIFTQGNMFNAIMRKLLSFSAEVEVLLVVDLEDYSDIENNKPKPVGELFPCSLDALVEDIWISPTAPAWLAATVEEISKLAGLNRAVRRSRLLDKPAY